MTNENNSLSTAAVELISNVSGTYSAPFWDGLRQVSGNLDTVRKIKIVIETLCSMGNESKAYDLILSMYDVIAVETPTAISELASYPDAIKRFVIEFLFDIDDLLIDYESEE